MLRFFFYGEDFSILIEFDNPESLRIINVVTKDSGFTIFRSLRCSLQDMAEPITIVNVISQHHCAGLVTNELLTDQESLGKAIRRWLNLVGQMNSELTPVSKKPLEIGKILWCRDEKNISYPCQHKRRQRIIHHRFIVSAGQSFLYHTSLVQYS